MSGPSRLPHRSLRVGTVPYLVGRPLDWGLENEPGIEIVRRAPAELVAGLRARELDVALVSSIELFRQPGYRYLANVAVSGAGFVGSVQVFLRRPLECVRSVALDPSSHAAAALVRVLLREPVRGFPHPESPDGAPSDMIEEREFIDVAPGQDPRAAGTDAWLRIGDAALREYLAPDAPPVFNPSAEWYRRTGLPFVFALWIVREDVIVDPHLEAFARARKTGLGRLEELARNASQAWGLAFEDCQKYLARECRYDPGRDLERALFAFRDAAAREGLCRADLQPTAIALEGEHVS